MASPRTLRLSPLPANARSLLVLALALAGAGVGPARAQCPPGRILGAHAPYPVGAGPIALALADLNEDGVLDLLTASGVPAGGATGSGAITVRLGRGTGGVGDGSFSAPAYWPAGTQLSSLVTGDFDEDGILDVAAGDYVGQRVVVLLGKGDAGVGDGTFAAPAFWASGTQPRAIVAGDFDEDGILDLVVGDEVEPGRIAVLHGLGSGGVGDGGFAPPVFYPVGSAPLALAVGDFDEDGIADLAATQWNGVAILRGAGTAGVGNGAFLPPVLEPMSLNALSIVCADFDEDGISDLATANHGIILLRDQGEGPVAAGYDGGSVRVLRGGGSDGHGDGTFHPEAIYPASNGAASIVTADWDGDGILDVAVANTHIDSVTVLLGQGIDDVGNGTFGEATTYRADDYPFALATADANEDGRSDLLVAQYISNEARVFLGGCAPHTGIGPRIAAVKDAPADQGGAVFVAWERSPYDGELSTLVRSYLVERQSDAGGAWESLATLPAQRLQGYGLLAATTRDSTPEENLLTRFRVTAQTADSEMRFESKADSGYSVDNLAPPPPEEFTAAYGAGVLLRWSAAGAPDHGRFRLHRGASEDFALSPASLVAQLVETSYLDAGGDDASWYKLVAVDRHGNESAPVLATRADGPGPQRLALALTRLAPNPAPDGRWSVSFTLLGETPSARLEVIDARGRVVFARAVSGPGTLAVPGERAALAPGVYVVRLREGGRAVQAKAVVLR